MIITNEIKEIVDQIVRVVSTVGEWSPSRGRKRGLLQNMRFEVVYTDKPDLLLLVCPDSNWAVELEVLIEGGIKNNRVFGDQESFIRDIIYMRMALGNG